MSTKTVNALRLKLSLPMAMGLVLSVALSVFLLRVADSASRTIGWIVFSSIIAAMLYPAVNFLHRYIPRGLAVLILVVFVIGMIGLPIYSVVDDINSQTAKLERTLPQRAAVLEKEGRFADSFKEFHLEEKTRAAIRYVPNALQGGTSQERIQANANRALAFVAGGVLMLFFLLYGHKLVSGALSVVQDEDQRERIKDLLHKAYSRSTIFCWSQIGLSIAAAAFTYATCRITHIPAAGLLAVWVALWNVVPVFGVVLGTLPVVVLAGAQSMRTAIVLLVLFIAYEVFESFMRHKLLGPHALRVDSFITIFVVFAGIELYGLGGALAGLVLVTFLHALASEVAATHPE